MTKKNIRKAVLTNVTAGMQLGITIFIFVYAGNELDEYYSKRPIFLIVGALIGFIAGFYNLLKDISRQDKIEKENSEKKQPDKWL